MGRPLRMDTILVGNDALAVDAAACCLMGIPANRVAHLCQTARDAARNLRAFEVVGDLRPHPFTFDAAHLLPAIQAKFANRRLHERMERFSNRWIDRAYRFRDDPSAFAKSAISKFARGSRGR